MRSALAFAALTLLAACTPPPASAPASAAGSEGGGAAAGDPLATTLSVEPTADSVRFLLQVTNATQGPLTLEFRSGQSFDFSVSDGGRTLWSWSADMMFTQALRSETLAAGETRSFDAAWRPPAELRGRTLTATGRLTSSNHPVMRTQAFRLP
ncbi:MAG: BsuPI-related putative proteinase inhibitor [Longimicrobiaceae bacterium]